jgi:hypothetical protein
MPDLSITAANVAVYADVAPRDGTAGATITAGQVLYEDTSDSNKLKLADCDSSSATATVVGIALHGASSGQPIKYAPSGELTIGATVTVGEIYVLSGTAGGIAPEADLASGDYVSILGVGTTAARIRFNILNSGVQVPA